MFTGFPAETIEFFLNLRFHNQTSFFEANREAYVTDVQAPFYAFIEAMAPTMAKIDPSIELRPYKCLARIRRDTRFTKDKSPYRDHLWLLFRKAGQPRQQSLMYWFELGPDALNWGMGFWSENRPVMDMMRRQMAAKPKGFLALIDDCQLPEHNLCLGGTSHKRIVVPDTIPERLRPWYTIKEMYIQRINIDPQWMYSPDLVSRVAKDFLTVAPLYRTFRGIMDDLDSAEC